MFSISELALAFCRVRVSTRNDEMSVAWRIDARPSMQPVVFPETGELVINDSHSPDYSI